MTNICIFRMKIKGQENSVRKLISYLEASSFYKGDKSVSCSNEKHLFRIYKYDIAYEYNAGCDLVTVINGYCANSVSSCMLEEETSNHVYLKERFEQGFKGATLEEVTKELDLMVEIYSREPKIGFMEHYIIDKGRLILDECADYKEGYSDDGKFNCQGGLSWQYVI